MPTIHVEHSAVTEIALTFFSMTPPIEQLTDAAKGGRLQQVAGVTITAPFDSQVFRALDKIYKSRESLRLWTEGRVDLNVE